MRDIVTEFGAEVTALEELLTELPAESWRLPTPAEGWDVRDSVTHLAASNELALECVVTGKSALIEHVLASGSYEAFEEEHLARGRSSTPAEVLDWWRASNAALAQALLAKSPTDRIPWGPNVMGAVSFTTARLMETWAHGLDCFDAAGVEPVDTDRLRHIAHLSLRALGFAFTVKGLPAPGPLRLELEAPGGGVWRLGPADAASSVSGTAGDWCRAAVNRDRRGERDRLDGSGPDAAAVIKHVQAYLSA